MLKGAIGRRYAEAIFDIALKENTIDRTLEDVDENLGVVAMRERTQFPRSLVERLPKLKLLVPAGMRNVAIDAKAAAELGIAVSGTGLLTPPTAELTWPQGNVKSGAF